MKLGYIGYGEAAHAIALGLAEGGLAQQYALSRTFSYAGKPEQAGVIRAASMAQLMEVCGTVFVTTPNTAARTMAEQAAPHLRPDIVYADLTSSSPEEMLWVAQIVEAAGAQFVDGAMLDNLPKYGHTVKTVISGGGAEALLARTAGLGMNLDYVGPRPGAASSIKLLRSLYTKAHLGFAIEMLEGAAAYGVEEYVMNTLAQTMDEKDFISGMSGRLCGGILHASRRAVELDLATEMLRNAGLSSHVASAAADKLREVGDWNLKDKLGDYRPKTWQEALACILRCRDAETPR